MEEAQTRVHKNKNGREINPFRFFYSIIPQPIIEKSKSSEFLWRDYLPQSCSVLRPWSQHYPLFGVRSLFLFLSYIMLLLILISFHPKRRYLPFYPLLGNRY